MYELVLYETIPLYRSTVRAHCNDTGVHEAMHTQVYSLCDHCIRTYSTAKVLKNGQARVSRFFRNMPDRKFEGKNRFQKTWLYSTFWVQNLRIALLS